MVRTLVYAGDTLAALVAEARWKEQSRTEEVPDIVTWLEQEIAEARETAFSLSVRQENGAEYWTGWADSLETLLKKIQRGEVRA
ncbi:hypothetical protein [Thermococcus henrietii]|uniref:hypothetical protein n=1 Tax=Thermococcus henrietii TaxID=2016361 RepID=UPI000C08BFB6|nr:hypothetical protein [Thermococcus henrietii]